MILIPARLDLPVVIKSVELTKDGKFVAHENAFLQNVMLTQK